MVTNEDGQETQKKVWGELAEKLERIEPGVTKVLLDWVGIVTAS